MTAPAKLRSISQSGRRARGQVEPVIFWIRQDGHLMLAPHTLMEPFPGYQKIECTTTTEIGKWSRIMATQAENELRGMKIEEHVRALPEWDRRIARCKARLEAGCVSDADEAITRSTLASFERKKIMLLNLLSGTGSLTNSCLEIEKTDAPIGAAEFQQKKVAIN